MVDLELQFSRTNLDANKLSDLNLLSIWNILNNSLPDHTIVYMHGKFQGWISALLYFKYKNYIYISMENIQNRELSQM